MKLESVKETKFHTFEASRFRDASNILGGVKHRMSSRGDGSFDEAEISAAPNGGNQWDEVIWRSSDYWSLTTWVADDL